MATNPCITPTDTIDLSTPGTPDSLRADLRVSTERGNTIRTIPDTADRGVTVLDGYVARRGGIGVEHPLHFSLGIQTPPTLGARVNVPVVGSVTAERPIVRLPGAGGDPFRVGTYDALDLGLDPTHPDFGNIQFAAADATNPRIDRVVLGWNGGQPSFQVKTGTPTSGATLDSLAGAAAIDNTSEVHWYDVLIDAGAISVSSTAKFRDRRPIIVGSGIPTSPSAGGPIVTLRQYGGGVDGGLVGLSAVGNDNNQAAQLVEIEQDVVANFLYWVYFQGNASALTGQYVLALFDVSQRLVLTTGTLNFQNPGNGAITRVRTPLAGVEAGLGGIPNLIRAGYYYAFFGITAMVGAGVHQMSAFSPGQTYQALHPRVMYHRSIGSTNVPATLSAGSLTDTYDDVATIASGVLFVPRFALGEA